MNKSDFVGFKQVFLFEFMTGIKKKGFLSFLAVLCVMGFVTMPAMVIVGNIRGNDGAKDGDKPKSAIESVYVYDETDLLISFENLKKNETYSEISFVTDESVTYDEAVAKLQENSDSKDLIIRTRYDSEEGFDVTIVHANKSGIKNKELDNFEEEFKEFYRDEVLKNLGVSEETFDYLSRKINVSVLKMDKNGEFSEEAERISLDDYFIMLAGLMIVFMFINMAVGNVATSIATEKSSRVIEYLLTGTRPMALLSGKIAARLLESAITFLAAFSCYYLSQLVCVLITAKGAVSDSASNNMLVVASIWETITLSKIIVALLYFLAGLVLYTIFGAITGASVSKLDELQEAYKYYSIVMVLCVYADMFLVIMMLSSGASEALQNFCAIFPLTGAFLTPAFVLTGKVSIITGVIALIIIIITSAAAFVLASAIYESMLLFQGKRLKVKDVVTLMKKQVVA